jgi:hypothetical protein
VVTVASSQDIAQDKHLRQGNNMSTTVTVTGNNTVDTVLQIINYADMAADIALPLAGQPELVALADALDVVVQKVAAAIATQTTNTLAAEVAAADLAAKAAEAAAGLK